MKVNNVVLTEHNLKEMVADWEYKLSGAIYLAQEDKQNLSEVVARLKELQARMVNITNS